MAVEAYVALGSNMGDRRGNIERAADALRARSTDLIMSSVYRTAPVGAIPQPEFANAVCKLTTTLDVFELLRVARGIERAAAPRAPVSNGPRALDVDILLYGRLVVALPHLVIPHPRMETREFVLRPLAEIAPRVVHPIRGKSAAKLLAEIQPRSSRGSMFGMASSIG